MCSFCGKPGVLNTCMMCGAHVCGQHFSNGMCPKCASKGGRFLRGDE
ncbi:MAG: orotate phosphoribosyltransferase [Candidatus Aenigmarchaeota archaeon]|nr:orotate phosphoribosyltransferase [Candidatus Aenigmarchaeota archaeon]